MDTFWGSRCRTSAGHPLAPPGVPQGAPREPSGTPGILQKLPRIFQNRSSLQNLYSILKDLIQNPLRILPESLESNQKPQNLPESCQKSFQNPHRILPELPACRILTVSSQIRSRILSESSQHHGNPTRNLGTSQNPVRILSDSLRNPPRIVPESFQNLQNPFIFLQKPPRILAEAFQNPFSTLP